MKYQHTPVMLEEVIKYLAPRQDQTIVDATLGGGGYTRAISKAIGPMGQVVALDADPWAIDHAKQWIKEGGFKNITLINGNFKNLTKLVAQTPIKQVDGIVFDLGLSSAQLTDEARGFSFQKEAPLNMAFQGGEKKSTTADIINHSQEAYLTDILRDYGEERYSGRIARAIVKARPLQTTTELVEVISQAVPARYRQDKRLHFATRTFQALRIATNDELNSLEQALRQSLNLLRPNGRLVVVSFHSLEDRLVKQFMKQESKDCICSSEQIVCQCNHRASLKILTKKVIKPSQLEINNNNRSRSAKLRAAQKIT